MAYTANQTLANILTEANISKNIQRNYKIVSVNVAQMADLIWLTEAQIEVIPYALATT